MITMNRISTAKKSKNGTPVTSRLGQTTYTKTVVGGNGMYVFVYGEGKKKKSETRHMSESQANTYKAQLEKAGY
jgi:hypothetical protein